MKYYLWSIEKCRKVRSGNGVFCVSKTVKQGMELTLDMGIKKEAVKFMTASVNTENPFPCPLKNSLAKNRFHVRP